MDQTTLNYVYILIAGVLLFLLKKLIVYLINKHRQYESVLIMGCSNSGKTVLFSYLIYKKIVSTYTSMMENTGMYNNQRHTIKITDVPGNERIRNQIFDKEKSSAQGILFMIDSESIQTEIRDVAEILFNILTDPVVRSNCKDLLIVCNKQDLTMAKGVTVIEMLLEREINMLRSLKGKQLDTISGESGKKKRPFLGNKKKDFEFAQLKPLNITFTEAVSYVSSDKDLQIGGIEEWLSKF